MSGSISRRLGCVERYLAKVDQEAARRKQGQPQPTSRQAVLEHFSDEELHTLLHDARLCADSTSLHSLLGNRYGWPTEAYAHLAFWNNPGPVVEAAEAELRYRTQNKLYIRFPAQGPFRRELYPKHLQFFRAGAGETERCFMAGNRVGKTEAAAYEVTLHLTGWYPDWWEGRKFCRPIKAWAVGETATTVRDIVQEKLLGPPGAPGTGMIPAAHVSKVTRKRGIAEAVDSIYVRHASGGISVVTLKSYQEGRESFQGTGIDVVWLDEEVPEDIYVETLTRLMSTNGILMLTFTPLKGLTPVVLRFLPAID